MEEVNNERGNEAQRNPNSHRRRQTVIRFARRRFQPATSEVEGLLATVDNNGDALVAARREVPTVIQLQHNVNNYESLGHSEMEEVNNERGNETQRSPNSHNEIGFVRRRQISIHGSRIRFQRATREADGLQASADNNRDALVAARRAVNGFPTVIEQQHIVHNYENLGHSEMEEVNNESSNEAQRNTNSHNEIRIVTRRQTAIRGARSRFQLPTREVDHLQVSVDNNGEALVAAGRAVNGLPTVIEHQGNVNNYESQGHSDMEEVNNERGNEVQRNTNSHNEIRIFRRRHLSIREGRNIFPLGRRDGDALVAARRVVNGLPTVILQQQSVNSADALICPICQELFSMDDSAKQLPCSHLYHGHCIVQWFNGRKFSCPVCRDESLLSQLQDAD